MFRKASDEALIKTMAADDGGALGELFRRYWKQLYQSAYHLLADDDEAQDAVQEVFINLWQRRHEINLHGAAKSYLFTAVRYRALNRIREIAADASLKERLDGYLERSFLETVDPLLIKELTAEIDRHIITLPDRMQQVLRLSYQEQLTAPEIAACLGISEDTVKNHLAAARKRMRSRLGQLAYLWLLLMIS